MRRRRNVVVKGMEIKDENIREAMEKLWRNIEAGAAIEKIKEIGNMNGKGKKMALVKLKDRKGKRVVMQKKKTLKGREERIEDLTQKESGGCSEDWRE